MAVTRGPGLGVTPASPLHFSPLLQICIQVVSRRPNSLSSQLTGTCSLLAPDLHPQVNVSFVNVGKDWILTGFGQLYRGLLGSPRRDASSLQMQGDPEAQRGQGRPRSLVKGIRAELSVGLPGGEQGGCLTLSSSICVFKENLLEPEAHAEAGDCHRNIKGSTENMARWRRALNVEEDGEEEEEEEAGEKRRIWVAPRHCPN